MACASALKTTNGSDAAPLRSPWRRLSATSPRFRSNKAWGLPNPTRSQLAQATMHGVKRTCGYAQREAKPLLRTERKSTRRRSLTAALYIPLPG
jgi:hypothetical protein